MWRKDCLENDVESYKLTHITISALELPSFYPIIIINRVTANYCQSLPQKSLWISAEMQLHLVIRQQGLWVLVKQAFCLRKVGQFHIMLHCWYRILTKIIFYIKIKNPIVLFLRLGISFEICSCSEDGYAVTLH